MQTPLITNFSRGILSPKFFGRVESELYHAGVAELKNFIVNPQGSIERRRGTYRIWDTGLTLPKATGEEDNRFIIPAATDEQYTIVVMSNVEDEAFIIISTTAKDSTDSMIHNYLQIKLMDWDQIGFPKAELAREVDVDANGDPVGDERIVLGKFPHNRQIDDAFVSRYHNLTFMRDKHTDGYSLKFWDSVISATRALAGDDPFVDKEIFPLPPPEYDKETPLLDQQFGYVVDGVTRITGVKRLPQFVGQIVRGSENTTFDQRVNVLNGTKRNASYETTPLPLKYPHGAFRIDVPASFTSHYHGEDRTFTFFDHVEENHLYFQSTLGKPKKKILPSYWVGNKAQNTVVVMVEGLYHALGETWYEQITHAHGRFWFAFHTKYNTYSRLLWFRVATHPKSQTLQRAETTAGHVADAQWGLARYLGKSYAPIETTAYIAPTHPQTDKDVYSLLYIDGGLRVPLADDNWALNNDGTNITSVTITNEANIDPESRMLATATARYELVRSPWTESENVVAERKVPWSLTEDINAATFKIVGSIDDQDVGMVYNPFPAKIRTNAMFAFIHGNRLMVVSKDPSEAPLIKASAIGDIVNFYEGVSDTGTYEFRFDTDIEESIRWVVAMREGVVIGTNRNEYVMVGGASPATVQVRRYTNNGSALPYAVRLGDRIIFASRDATDLFSYAYSDELAAWHSESITSVAEHLFRDGILSFRYMPEPYRMLWVVPKGRHGLYSFTWEPNTGVMAWAQHMDGDDILATNVVSIGHKTILLVLVRRGDRAVLEALDMNDQNSRNGEVYADSSEYWSFSRYIDANDSLEKLAVNGMVITENITIEFGTAKYARFQGSPIVFMRDGQTVAVYEGDNVPHTGTALTMGPFEGADIFIEFPGDVGDGVEDAIVAMGIPYVSRMKTLPILTQSPTGAGVFKKTQVRKMRVRINDSNTFKVGNDLSDLTHVETADQNDLVETEEGTYTGDVEVEIQSRWMKRPEIYVESYYADPLNVLALMVDTQVYE